MSERFCPEYVEALLRGIESELCRIMGNINQEYDSPFENTGNEFICPKFEVRAYYWGDDEDEIKKPNFKYGDLEISWYKYLGRGMTINKRITSEKMVKIFNECIFYLRKFEYVNDDCLCRSFPTKKEITNNSKCRVSWWRRLWLKWKYRNEFKTED